MRLSFKRRRTTAPPPAPPTAPQVDLPAYAPVISENPLTELDELMAANRARRDPAVEKRIVQLRHAAFAQLGGANGNGFAASESPSGERLPSPDGLPEVSPEELDANSLRDGILGGGSLLIRGLLDGERSERLRDGIDRAFAGRDAFLRGADASETTPWFDPFAPSPQYELDAAQWNRLKLGGGAAWTPDSPRMMFELLDAFAHVGLSRLIAEYLGERPALSMNKSVLRRVSPESGTDWHQDGAFLGRGIRTVNVWIALSRCGDMAPGLDVVSRRYDEIVETGTDGAFFPWAVAPQMVERSRGDAAVARPIFEAGDVLLFDHLCMHRTAVAPEMTEDRYATETWSFAPSVYPDDTVPLVL